jgi:hypothetical protein
MRTNSSLRAVRIKASHLHGRSPPFRGNAQMPLTYEKVGYLSLLSCQSAPFSSVAKLTHAA